MDYLGIVRDIDEAGRIVIPKEIRRSFDLESKDSMEILVNENHEIILRKCQNKCIFCGSEKELVKFSEKNICSECIEKISKL